MYYALAYHDPQRREPDLFDLALLPAELRPVVIKALQANPSQRHQDAAEFRASLVAAQIVRHIEITLRGGWYARPAHSPQAEWIRVTGTPATVSLLRQEVYRLTVESEGDHGLSDLAHLRGLTGLQSLNLSFCKQVTDAGLDHLRGLTTVPQSLELSFCKQVTDAGLAHLHGLTALQSLELSGCERVTDAGLAHLRGLTAPSVAEPVILHASDRRGVGPPPQPHRGSSRWNCRAARR